MQKEKPVRLLQKMEKQHQTDKRKKHMKTFICLLFVSVFGSGFKKVQIGRFKVITERRLKGQKQSWSSFVLEVGCIVAFNKLYFIKDSVL